MIVNRAYLYFAFKIKDAIFIGDFNSPHEKDFLITNKITTIINCAQGQIRTITHPFPLKIIEFNWKDSDDQIILDEKDENINKIYDAIYETVDKGESVLVCSMRGQSRALTLISAFFMKRYKWTLYKTLEFMNSKRSDFEIRANFLKQLVNFEKRLFGDDLSQCSRTWKDDNNQEPEAEMMKNTFLNSQKQIPFPEVQKQKTLSNSMQKSIQKICWSTEIAQEMKEDQNIKNENKLNQQLQNKKPILKNKAERNAYLSQIEEIGVDNKDLKEKDPNLAQLEQYKNEFLTNSLLKSESKTYEQIYKRDMMNLSRESPIHLRKKTTDLSLPNFQVIDCKQKINMNEQNQQNNNTGNNHLDLNQKNQDFIQVNKQEKNMDQQMRESKFLKDQPFQGQQNNALFQIKSNQINGVSPNLSRNPTPQQQKQNKQYRKSPIPLPFHSRRFMYKSNNENNINNEQNNLNGQLNQNTYNLQSEEQSNKDNLNLTQYIQPNLQQHTRFQNNQPSNNNFQNSNSSLANNSIRVPTKKLSQDQIENNENDTNKLENFKINPNQISLPSTNRNSQNQQIITTPPINQQNVQSIGSTSQVPQSNMALVNLNELNNSSFHQQQPNSSFNHSFRSNNMNATKVANFRKLSSSNNNSPDHKSSTQNYFKNGLQNGNQNNQINKIPIQQYSTPKNPQDLGILSSKKKNTFSFYDNNSNNNQLNNSIIKSPYANFLPSLKDKTQKFTLPKKGIYSHHNQEVSNTEGNSPVNQNQNNFVFTEVTIDGYLNQDLVLNQNHQNQESDQFKLNLQKARNTVNSKDNPTAIQAVHPRDQRSFSMAEQRRIQTEQSADTYLQQKKKQTIQQINNTTWLTPKELDPIQKLQNPIKSISIKTYEKKTPKYFKNVLRKEPLFQQQQQLTNITLS
ncbi:dual specificity phosphatase domain protein (macronuclear) [Tetrahymena thermophila SB210]|uniref:Dual specificity phosphatase domain protein n=1 Tax=Tetrahymena thermophila (strain SB210) TaxID=312017 RepID=I7M814_TETTS|nr:dual specificity phosphatase domain protein [Tetrahymena thermophila SB210]EAR96418.2 dual specificity phosphatase domain protein [Tetrahymena thermophila SB210]|eukprot:XP_001016663.2 dual specificity phosphatase domain protein [Tetrahymena thermophila SB210]